MSQSHILVLTDIVDSTALVERLGDEASARLWAAHDRLARDLLHRWRGREIDKADGLLMLFDQAADALNFVWAYHRALATLAVPLQARAGLHAGALTLRENDPADVALGAKPLEVDGIAKPTTARVMAIAHGGQTLLTAEACAALGDPCAALGHPGAALRSCGHWRAKGLQAPFELFEFVAPDGPALPPPASSPKAYRVARQGDHWLPVEHVERQLPAERDAFVGRSQALGQIAARLGDGARLLSLVGIGGCGKTRLAVHFAWAWLGDFPGGVWFCDLAPARDVDGIVRAVAATLDLPLSAEDSIRQIGQAIAARGRCLLVLDNFEQVQGHAEATLGTWLDRASQACFLVTTREVLGLAGEQVFALAPLDPDEAAELFTRRAQSAQSSASREHPPSPQDEAAIGPLVRLLDGLPLAIELAAARVRVMPTRLLLQRMSERFKLLASTGGRRDRQATLRATFDWSWDLLSGPDRAALAQLSVFEGGFTLEAAEAVLDLGPDDGARWPADAVHSLVDKSFVRPGADDRFDLLSSMQAYAAEHLRTPGHFDGSGPVARQAAQARHAAYFATLGDERAAAQRGVELENLVAACRWAAAAGQTQTAVDLLDGAWAALRLRGPFRIGAELAAQLQALAGLDAAQTASVRRVAGQALVASGQRAEARPHFEAALQLAGDAGDRLGQARALCQLGHLDLAAGQADAAQRCFVQALHGAQALHDHGLECEVRNGLGTLHDTLGQLDEALQQYQAGLALARRVGNQRREAGLRGNIGNVHASQGRMAEAQADYEAALHAAREVGDRVYEGNMLCNLGYLHLTEGRPLDGQACFEPALALARDLGHAQLECIVLCNLALVADALGQRQDAMRHYEAALTIARQLRSLGSEGQILGYLGPLMAAEGRLDEARRSLEEGARLLAEVSDRFSLGVLVGNWAEVEALAGQTGTARELLDQATALAQDIGAGPASELGLSLARVAGLLDGQLPGG